MQPSSSLSQSSNITKFIKLKNKLTFYFVVDWNSWQQINSEQKINDVHLSVQFYLLSIFFDLVLAESLEQSL